MALVSWTSNMPPQPNSSIVGSPLFIFWPALLYFSIIIPIYVAALGAYALSKYAGLSQKIVSGVLALALAALWAWAVPQLFWA
jgi:hypothetical protein